MRIDVKKFLFLGAEEEKDRFFRKAQDAGIIHFIEPEKAAGFEAPQEIQNIMSATKVLRALPVVEQVELEDQEQADRITAEILDRKNRLDKLFEEERVVRLEMARIEVFGDFSMDDLAFIEKEGKRHVQFFFCKQGLIPEEELPEEMFWMAADHGLDYYVAVNETPRQYDKMIEMHFEDSYGNLKKRAVEIHHHIHRLEEALKSYVKYNTYLHHALVYKLNQYHRNQAEGYALSAMNDRLFFVTGWVPEDKEVQMREVADEQEIRVEEIAIEEGDVIPTYLENRGASRVGEDLVHIYDTPSITDKDPSLWVLCAFSIFFSLIVSDGGYGSIFLATALFILWKSKKVTKAGQRVLNLAIILSTCCVIWGVASNSFFGIEFPVNSPAQKFSFVHWLAVKKAEYHIDHKDSIWQEWVKKFPDLKNVKTADEFFLKGTKKMDGRTTYEIFQKFSDSIMMEMALFIGMTHISLSFARYLGRNWSGIGWILVIFGGYLYFPEYLKGASMLQYVLGINLHQGALSGFYLMIGGFALAILLKVISDGFSGLLEIAGVIQVFADILSYLRIYALGLAGGIISATINELAGSLFALAGVLLIIVGHIVNMALSIMGGVIHGLRLNFIEWYHYSFDGGGKAFDPLKRIEIE